MARGDGAREYFEKLKLVEKFCSGDIEIAKKILKGEFQDVIAIKGRFKNETEEHYGLFLLFISKISNHVIHAFSVISEKASVYQNKPFDDWKTFFDRLERELGDAEYDNDKTETLDNVLQRLEELKLYKNLFEWVESNDIMSLTERFERIINKVLNIDDSQVVLDFETITSIVLYEEKGIKPI